MSKIRIAFVITSLAVGGAEMMLLRLLKSLDREIYEIQVITLKSGGTLESEIKALGIPLQSAEMNTIRKALGGVFRLYVFLRAAQPDVVFCWMYHANLIGGLAAKLAGIRVFWGVRHDSLDPTLLKHQTIWVAKSSAPLSHWLPERIIFCSESSMREHVKIGFDPKKSSVIPNGFDTETYRSDTEARRAFRQELGIPPEAFVVGHAGRFDPTKDHHSMVRAAGLVAQKVSRVYFIFCGHGVNEQNAEMVGWLKEAGIEKWSRLLGERSDMSKVYSAMDVFASSSVSEAFPNVVGEAMSCEVPCVVTDVGDSALIVGKTGLVVPPGDPSALTDAVIQMLSNKDLRTELGKKARIRIDGNFSLQQITNEYESLLKKLN
jgi:glycosyltransferase involved in cell wall biosynthesis